MHSLAEVKFFFKWEDNVFARACIGSGKRFRAELPYQVVKLLHPNGETHHVAVPSGTDLSHIAANNREYHREETPSGGGMFFHRDGSIRQA